MITEKETQKQRVGLTRNGDSITSDQLDENGYYNDEESWLKYRPLYDGCSNGTCKYEPEPGNHYKKHTIYPTMFFTYSPESSRNPPHKDGEPSKLTFDIDKQQCISFRLGEDEGVRQKNLDVSKEVYIDITGHGEIPQVNLYTLRGGKRQKKINCGDCLPPWKKDVRRKTFVVRKKFILPWENLSARWPRIDIEVVMPPDAYFSRGQFHLTKMEVYMPISRITVEVNKIPTNVNLTFETTNVELTHKSLYEPPSTPLGTLLVSDSANWYPDTSGNTPAKDRGMSVESIVKENSVGWEKVLTVVHIMLSILIALLLLWPFL